MTCARFAVLWAGVRNQLPHDCKCALWLLNPSQCRSRLWMFLRGRRNMKLSTCAAVTMSALAAIPGRVDAAIVIDISDIGSDVVA